MFVVVMAVLGVISVFAIAAVAVGREARRLDAIAPRAVYDLDEAVGFVADRLPAFAQAELTPDELATLLRMHLSQLRDKGLQPPAAVDQPQDIDVPVVVEDTSAVGYVIDRAERAGLVVSDAAIAAAIEEHFAYLDAIGAVGPLASDPDLRS